MNDGLKIFLDRNLKNTPQRPTQEWAQIVERIQTNGRWWHLSIPKFALGSGLLAATLAIALLINPNLSRHSVLTNAEVEEFLSDSYLSLQDEDSGGFDIDSGYALLLQ